METIDLVVSTDHRYIMPTGVLIHSVCKNNMDQDVRFHVIVDESVTKEDREDIRVVAGRNTVRFYDVDSRSFSTMPLAPGLSPATYYRLLIPHILPGDIRKVLYLDSDIIVRHSLLPLWETDINRYAIAAVTDVDEALIEKYNRQKYSPSLGHFNAGVLLINLDYWRENNIHSEIELYIKTHVEDIRFADQDILNYVLQKRKITLPIKYNTQTCFLWVLDKVRYDYWKYEKEVLEARKDPVIIHYSNADCKPWMEDCIHPFSSSFFKYQNETKWKGQIWAKPKRSFVKKVISHTNAAVMRILIKMSLHKAPAECQDTNLFLDLQPID